MYIYRFIHDTHMYIYNNMDVYIYIYIIYICLVLYSVTTQRTQHLRLTGVLESRRRVAVGWHVSLQGAMLRGLGFRVQGLGVEGFRV